MGQRNQYIFISSTVSVCMPEKKVYFIHPSITYHSRTERRCENLMNSKLEGDLDIMGPSNLSKEEIRSWKEDIEDMDIVVGLALEEKYTVSVWKVMEYADDLEKSIYTIKVNESTIKWREGILEDVKKLSLEETRDFTRKIVLDDGKSMLKGLFFGNRSKY